MVGYGKEGKETMNLMGITYQGLEFDLDDFNKKEIILEIKTNVYEYFKRDKIII